MHCRGHFLPGVVVPGRVESAVDATWKAESGTHITLDASKRHHAGWKQWWTDFILPICLTFKKKTVHQKGLTIFTNAGSTDFFT